MTYIIQPTQLNQAMYPYYEAIFSNRTPVHKQLKVGSTIKFNSVEELNNYVNQVSQDELVRDYIVSGKLESDNG